MKRLALLGAVLSLVMALAIVVPGFAAPTLPAAAQGHTRITRPLQAGMVLSITGSGTAFQISDQSTTQTATISLTVNVVRVSWGGAILSVTGGQLMITGSDTWTVDSGRGLVNFHSGKVLLKVSVKDSSGNTSHLVLFGKVTGQLSSTLNVNDSFNVDFLSHQSKLAGKWFLEFKGAKATRTS